MIKSIQISGKTEEEALAAALAQLGRERDEVSVEIIERGRSGFLGIGGQPTVLKVSYEEMDTPEEKLTQFLTGLFERMGVTAEISTSVGEDGSISAVLSGPHAGAIIGRRGETLDAIQHLSNYVVNRDKDDRVKISIDAENYRAKRTDALTQLAVKVANKVVKYRRSVTLEPMNAYERHVIHAALQDFEGVTTFSTGTEPNRHVVVAYERPPKPETPRTREWA